MSCHRNSCDGGWPDRGQDQASGAQAQIPKYYNEKVRPALRVLELEKQGWGRGKRTAVVAEVAG